MREIGVRGHRFSMPLGLSRRARMPSIGAGCGDDDETTTSSTSTSAGSSAEQTVDQAVKSCSDEASQLGGSAGTALASACTSVGKTATQALSSGSEDAKQALSQAASSCKSAVNQLPSGQAPDALTKLCDAIASAERPEQLLPVESHTDCKSTDRMGSREL